MAVFNQSFTTVTNVYNGEIILTAQSSAGDLAQRIAEIRAALATEPELAPAARAAAAAELDKAEAASKAPAPSGATVKAHLERAGQAIKTASDISGNSVKLATTLFAIGTWAAQFLV